MRTITTMGELAEEMAKVHAAPTDAARRRQFAAFEMSVPADLPLDPESDAYRERQLALYAAIAGRPYAVSNERTLFDVAAMADKPFPYLNEGWEVTGDQLIAMGWLFKAMKLPPRASVLEFGPGWGNTTLALAQNGHPVTAIEIEPNFCALIAERARRNNVAIEVRRGDFLDAADLGRRFDAVLFFECFHHCADHARLFDLLRALVAPDGVAAFCAEPIDESFKHPWGLRLDGQSLWAISANGWLELGFTESYFIAQLMARGFVVERHASSASPLARCLVARHARGRYEMARFTLPPDEDRGWCEPESDPSLVLRFAGERSLVTLERGGDYDRIEVALRNFAPLSLTVRLAFGRRELDYTLPPHSEALVTLPYDRDGRTLSIGSRTWRPADFPAMNNADARSLGIGVSTVRLA